MPLTLPLSFAALPRVSVIELRSELDRVVTFKGEWVNSAIVHGSDQRWAKDVLIAELRREEDIAAQKIMNAKVRV